MTTMVKKLIISLLLLCSLSACGTKNKGKISSAKTDTTYTQSSPKYYAMQKKIDSTLRFVCKYKYRSLKIIDILDEPFINLPYVSCQKENEILLLQESIIKLLKNKNHDSQHIYYSNICVENFPSTVKLVYGLSGDYGPNQIILLSFKDEKLIDAYVAAEYFGDSNDYSFIISEFNGKNIGMKKTRANSIRSMTTPDTLNIMKAEYFSVVYNNGYFVEKLDSTKTNLKEVKIWKQHSENRR